MDPNPYPIKYIKPIQLKDGTLIQLRPVHPQDSKQATAFKASLSLESLYARFHGFIPPVSDDMVKRLTEIDYSKEMAIVGEVIINDQKEVIAIARIVDDGKTSVEFAVIISDQWQGKKLGIFLTDYMIKIAKDMGFQAIYAHVQNQNIPMLEILRKLKFEFESMEQGSKRARLKLS